MASSIIHICVANEINKKIKKDTKRLLIGSIAPDISKQVGESRSKSHFYVDNYTNHLKFLDKYERYLNDDFVLGYYIHLYTDYLWEKYFITELGTKNLIKKLNGDIVKCNGEMYRLYIYSDYTSLNSQIIDEYELNLAIFYEDIPQIDNIIEEIPMDKINVIIEKMGIIIANSKPRKEFVFDLAAVKKFIDLSVDIITSDINNRI